MTVAADVEREFTRLCGGDVTFLEMCTTRRSLMVRFKVAGIEELFWTSAEMPNGTTTALRKATMVCAKRALEWAYNATGEREFDMKQLMNGKVRKR